MRRLLAPLIALALVPLAACGGGDGNDIAPDPAATAPAPRTPVAEVTPVPGNEAEWMGARDAAGDPRRAPFDDLHSQPVVPAPDQR